MENSSLCFSCHVSYQQKRLICSLKVNHHLRAIFKCHSVFLSFLPRANKLNDSFDAKWGFRKACCWTCQKSMLSCWLASQIFLHADGNKNSHIYKVISEIFQKTLMPIKRIRASNKSTRTSITGNKETGDEIIIGKWMKSNTTHTFSFTLGCYMKWVICK